MAGMPDLATRPRHQTRPDCQQDTFGDLRAPRGRGAPAPRPPRHPCGFAYLWLATLAPLGLAWVGLTLLVVSLI